MLLDLDEAIGVSLVEARPHKQFALRVGLNKLADRVPTHE